MIEQLNELKAKNQNDFRNWIEDLLRTNKTESPKIFSREEHPSIVLLGLYKAGRDLKFQRRIREIVTDLFFSYHDSDLEYFHELIILIAELRLVDCYKELISKTRSGEFKGEIVHGLDLHYQLLRVLYSFKNYREQDFGKDLEMIIKDNIKRDIYFSISFRANWERTSLENGVKALFELLDVIDTIPEPFVDFTLKTFFRKIDSDLFCKTLKERWPGLGIKRQSTLIFLLSRINVCIMKPTQYEFLEGSMKKDILVVKWHVDERYPPETSLVYLSCDEDSAAMREALAQSHLEAMKLSCDFSRNNRVVGTKGLVRCYGE
jgi:hypothetical protein